MVDRQTTSILIIRLSAIGDVAMASGLPAPLRARYPRARLVWLVQPEAKDLIESHPDLDEVIVWPRGEWARLARGGHWWRLWREMRAFVRALRARRFDLAIDLQGLLKSAVWAWLSGARKRIGLNSREGSARLMTRVIRTRDDDPRIASEYRDLIDALGGSARDYRMMLALTEADVSAARELLVRLGVTGRYAVICPFTTRPQKHWFESHWVELIPRLTSDMGLAVVMLGGPGDAVAAARIAQGRSVTNLVGQTSLRQAAALIRGAALLVGVDTALTHMGTAFEIPTVALFGSTRPYLRTDSAKTEVVYRNLDCAPCRRNPTCHGAYTCMRLISADDVLASARRLLA